jgi:hypothetical protein
VPRRRSSSGSGRSAPHQPATVAHQGGCAGQGRRDGPRWVARAARILGGFGVAWAFVGARSLRHLLRSRTRIRPPRAPLAALAPGFLPPRRSAGGAGRLGRRVTRVRLRHRPHNDSAAAPASRSRRGSLRAMLDAFSARLRRCRARCRLVSRWDRDCAPAPSGAGLSRSSAPTALPHPEFRRTWSASRAGPVREHLSRAGDSARVVAAPVSARARCTGSDAKYARSSSSGSGLWDGDVRRAGPSGSTSPGGARGLLRTPGGARVTIDAVHFMVAPPPRRPPRDRADCRATCAR